MKNWLMSACTVAFLLCSSGCEDRPKQDFIPEESPAIPASRTLTLSQQQLVSLDWHGPRLSGGAQVTQKRIVPGTGVEFDIHFPSNQPSDSSVNYTSSGQGGLGTMVGIDIRGYETFELSFTLVSINGKKTPDIKEELVVGALIGLTNTSFIRDHKPVTLSLLSSENSKMARAPVGTDYIHQIGFHVHLVNPGQWDPEGSRVVIRIEPAEDAGTVPW